MKIKNKTKVIALLSCLLFICCAPDTSWARKMIAPDQIRYPALDFKMPQAEQIQLPNGMTLFYMGNRELPLVGLSAMLRTGTMRDPAGKEGVAQLTADLLRTGGTVKIKSDELDRQLDKLAASPSFSMSLDSASIHFSFLKSDLDAALDLLSQMMREPAFEEKKMQLAVSLHEESLRRMADNPQQLAFREFNRLLYPQDLRGRYATLASLQNIRRDDLVTFHQTYFYPANIMIAVCGDLSKEEAVLKIRQYFGDWNHSGRRLDIPDAPAVAGNGVFFIKKSLPQSTVVSGEFTVGKRHPDFYPFTVLDFIIGSGGFPSRIFTAVRNNEGLAYSAGSFYRARPNYGVFGTYAFTKTESTYQSLHLMSSILKDVAGGSISDHELAWAKKSILTGFVFSFEHPDQIVSQQMAMAFENLPADYLITYRQKIEAVTRTDLQRVAKQNINEKKRLTLILGEADKFGKWQDPLVKPVYITPTP